MKNIFNPSYIAFSHDWSFLHVQESSVAIHFTHWNYECFLSCVLDTVLSKQLHILVYVVHSFMLFSQILQRNFSSHRFYGPELPSRFCGAHNVFVCTTNCSMNESACTSTELGNCMLTRQTTTFSHFYAFAQQTVLFFKCKSNYIVIIQTSKDLDKEGNSIFTHPVTINS